MQVLVDTGVWLRLFDRTDPQHLMIRSALVSLRSNGHELVAAPQNIAEFWNVSTRPASARGGYGKSVATTELRVQFIERNARVVEDLPSAYPTWRQLLVQYQIKGLSVHDARLVALMLSHRIDHVLTLNVADFQRYAITAIWPGDAHALIST